MNELGGTHGQNKNNSLRLRHGCSDIHGGERDRYRRNEKVASLADNVDFIVSTTPISASVNKPVIKGLPFLTGIGKDQVLDQIEAELRK